MSQPVKVSTGQTSGLNSGTATPAAQTFVAQDWQQTPQRNAADLEWSLAEGGEEEEWECVACGKSFRSEAAWDSHERSKKHLKAVERLAREMAEENDALGLEEDMAALAVEDDGQTDGNSEAIKPPANDGAEDYNPDIPIASDNQEMEDEWPTGRRAKKSKSNKPSRTSSPSPRASRNSRRRRNRNAEEEPDPSTPPTPSAVGVADPSPSLVQEGREEDTEATAGTDAETALMEAHPPGDGESGARAVQSEVSKREKRRAREAAKKMMVSEVVRITTSSPRPVHFGPCTHTQSTRISGRSLCIADVFPGLADTDPRFSLVYLTALRRALHATSILPALRVF